MTRLSAERFNMRQRARDAERAARYAVLVINAACGHPVDVQLTGAASANAALVTAAQTINCVACGSSIVKRLPMSTRED